MKTTVVLPTYNEASNLRQIVQALLALGVPGLDILIVDDASPDGTGGIADELARQQSTRVRVVHRQVKSGLGTAYLVGFRAALELGAQAIVQMDADFSHSPDYLPQLLAALDRHDVAVGSRYVPGGSLDEGWEFGRRLLSWWANAYARRILGLRVRDATAGFKAWHREALLGLGLERVQSNGYVFQVEMAYLTQRLGYDAVEIPIHFEDRRIGQSKMSIPIKFEAMWRVWQVRWRHHGLTPARRHQLA